MAFTSTPLRLVLAALPRLHIAGHGWSSLGRARWQSDDGARRARLSINARFCAWMRISVWVTTKEPIITTLCFEWDCAYRETPRDCYAVVSSGNQNSYCRAARLSLTLPFFVGCWAEWCGVVLCARRDVMIIGLYVLRWGLRSLSVAAGGRSRKFNIFQAAARRARRCVAFVCVG